MRWRSPHLRCGCVLATLVVAGLPSVVAAACSNSPSPAPTASASPSLPQVVATVSAATPRNAFTRYLTDRLSHQSHPGLPSGSWDFHRFGPVSSDSATFELTVRFTLREPDPQARLLGHLQRHPRPFGAAVDDRPHLSACAARAAHPTVGGRAVTREVCGRGRPNKRVNLTRSTVPVVTSDRSPAQVTRITLG